MMVSLCVDPKVGYRCLSTPSWGSWWKFGVIGFYFSYITRHSSSVFPTALVCPDKWRNIRRPGGKDQRRHIRLDLLNILWSWHSSWWYKRLVCACVCVGGGAGCLRRQETWMKVRSCIDIVKRGSVNVPHAFGVCQRVPNGKTTSINTRKDKEVANRDMSVVTIHTTSSIEDL